jgi:hypothetical protein
MSPYYEGVRYQVTAFYHAERQVESVGSRKAANVLVRKHLKAGVNVELCQTKWIEHRSHLAFYTAPDRSSK